MLSLVDASALRFEHGFLDADTGEHWVLIVAGSSGWDNYRHQADACHAYQIMRKHGVPANRIVTMMYDDIAHNGQNPTPGIVINHPNGQDVYGGVVIDYKGKDVTPQNFLAVLGGDADKMKGIGSGRVINSGPNDHVFVNFADHGAPGILAFPDDELKARDFMNTILKMHENKKYNQLVLYIEACESGSMFEGLLPSNISAWATTAANGEESSYAIYYDQKRETYLGDVYSVMWMEDSDKENLNVETLQQQYLIVKNETTTSHVMEYGDMAISNDHVSEFQSGTSSITPEPIILPAVPFDAVPSEYVPLAILHHRLMAAKDHTEEKIIREKMMSLLELGQRVDDTVKSIVDFATRDSHHANRIMGTKYRLTAWDCYEPVFELFDERCFDVSKVDHARRRLYALVNLCEERIPVELIMESIAKMCPSHN